MLLLTESLITFRGDFVIFAAILMDDSLLLRENSYLLKDEKITEEM